MDSPPGGEIRVASAISTANLAQSACARIRVRNAATIAVLLQHGVRPPAGVSASETETSGG